MRRFRAVLFVGLLLFAAAPARAEGPAAAATSTISTAKDWLGRESDVFGLTHGQLAMIGGGVVVGGALFLFQPTVGGVVGGLIVLDIALHAAMAAGVGGAVVLGYDLEEDLGVPPFWKDIPRFWEKWTDGFNAASP